MRRACNQSSRARSTCRGSVSNPCCFGRRLTALGLTRWGRCGSRRRPRLVSRSVGRKGTFYFSDGNLTAGGGKSVTWYADNHPYQIQANGATETFRYSPDGNRYLRVDTTPQAAWFMTDRRSDLQLLEIGHRRILFVTTLCGATILATIRTGLFQ